MSKTMAEVLAEHYTRYRWYSGLQENLWECTSLHCDFWSETFDAAVDHQAAALSAAGFGLVADTKAEALEEAAEAAGVTFVSHWLKTRAESLRAAS